MTAATTLAPVVIGCTGGSGSRMLRDILAASPEIYMDQDCSENSKDSRGSKVFLDRDDIDSGEYRSLVEQFMESLRGRIPLEVVGRTKWYGWKNPRNIHIAELLLDIHPSLRFLHLVRDPATLVDGSQARKKYKEVRARGDTDGESDREAFVLARWARVNLPLWRRQRDNPRYCLVHYEDLVRCPTEAIESLFAWLGLDMRDSKKMPSQNKDNLVTGI